MGNGISDQVKQVSTPQIEARVDPNQIEILIREHSGWMLALCRRLLGETALAEDGVQDAMINAFRKLPQLEDPLALKAWLYRVTLNSCLSILRARRRQEQELPDGTFPEFDANGCRIEPVWTQFESPEDLLSRDETRAFVLAKIAELPEKYRLLILLRDIEELSTTQTAELLGLSESNTKVRLHRARSALKRLLEPMMRGDET